MTDDVILDTTDGPMGAAVSHPAGVPKGGVVVIQEAFGLTPHLRSVCDRLAAAGWLAVAPAFFHRTGAPVLGYDDFDAVRPHMAALDADGLATDMNAALDLLQAEGVPWMRRGTVGFCMGGSVSLWAATVFELGAAVTFYGGGLVEGRFGLPPLIDAAPTLRCPWLGLFGDLDRGIPPEQVEQLRAAAATSAVETEVRRYPDAGHGFNCDDRDAYHEPSATDAWAATLAWFDAHLLG